MAVAPLVRFLPAQQSLFFLIAALFMPSSASVSTPSAGRRGAIAGPASALAAASAVATIDTAIACLAVCVCGAGRRGARCLALGTRPSDDDTDGLARFLFFAHHAHATAHPAHDGRERAVEWAAARAAVRFAVRRGAVARDNNGAWWRPCSGPGP